MTFNCNHCLWSIPFQMWGADTIKCPCCGAKYTKTVTVEVKEKN